MYDQGVFKSPPWHPSSLAQKQVSCALNGTATVALDQMHKRSEAASAAPNAQQHPQADSVGVVGGGGCGWGWLAVAMPRGEGDEERTGSVSDTRGWQWVHVNELAAWVVVTYTRGLL